MINFDYETIRNLERSKDLIDFIALVMCNVDEIDYIIFLTKLYEVLSKNFSRELGLLMGSMKLLI
ncbi:hypothetical protein COD78_28265 [Bacillus cereus]|uniref:Uncharacterized protein n=1 Tax=Bacillus cereus TaxID=1396 RepID=A0A9X6VRL3_BACCE|nr:hypothetical protein BK713_05735 [Bacillus thuringiensis serovar jinghongiensis]OTX19935.1 hypothetical protein BK715_08335 [Bacillus thuringiensis serovar japonensis]PDZ75982.1 hypothetical protein CON31_30125 [Bacillus cereus]PEC04137.1 hypothetical protein COM98_14630 [Bacillus cereus]PEW25126.1 hypothetical protein CN441_30600 [Bacillus cereus]